MKKIIYIFAIVLFTASCNQPSKVDQVKNLKIQADSLRQAMVVLNTSIVIKYSYPEYILSLGGREKMVAMLIDGKKAKENHSIFLKSIKLGEPSALKSNNDELQSTISTTTETSTSNGTIIEESSWIAISNDNGLNWRFINTNGLKINQLKEKYKNLNAELILPETKTTLKPI